MTSNTGGGSEGGELETPGCLLLKTAPRDPDGQTSISHRTGTPLSSSADKQFPSERLFGSAEEVADAVGYAVPGGWGAAESADEAFLESGGVLPWRAREGGERETKEEVG